MKHIDIIYDGFMMGNALQSYYGTWTYDGKKKNDDGRFHPFMSRSRPSNTPVYIVFHTQVSNVLNASNSNRSLFNFISQT